MLIGTIRLATRLVLNPRASREPSSRRAS
ncbi:hypothetical protein LINPERPRIM_LOCUS41315 [Linum perenne]